MESIVIIGAGFAGAYAAKTLLKKLPSDCKLILINKQPYFTFKPLLHEVATGLFNTDIIREDIPTFLRHKNFEFVEGTATKIDFKKQAVTVNGKQIAYDYLLVSIGAQTNFFNILGAEKHALKLDSIDDTFKIKNTLLDISKKASPKIVMVGGGPTGIEVSTEIAEFTTQLNPDFSITVVELSSLLLPELKAKFSSNVQKFFEKKNIKLLLGTSVVKVGKNFVLTNKKQKLPADLIIWAAGIKPYPIEMNPKLQLYNGFFPVDRYLRVKNLKNVFAVGDCAFAKNPDGKPVPQLAQSAEDEGKFVANNILATVNKDPLKKFIFHNRGFVLPLGKGYAVADVKGFIFSGFFAWWLNRVIYLVSMPGFTHKLYVILRWKLDFFRKRDTKKLP